MVNVTPGCKACSVRCALQILYMFGFGCIIIEPRHQWSFTILVQLRSHIYLLILWGRLQAAFEPRATLCAGKGNTPNNALYSFVLAGA